MTELLLYDPDSETVYPTFDENDKTESQVVIGRLDLDSPKDKKPDIGIFYSDDMPEGIYTSRRHCLIEKFGDDYTVRDLKSSNKTFLNGELVTTSHEIGDLLRNCDVLRLGLHGLEVIIKR